MPRVSLIRPTSPRVIYFTTGLVDDINGLPLFILAEGSTEYVQFENEVHEIVQPDWEPTRPGEENLAH